MFLKCIKNEIRIQNNWFNWTCEEVILWIVRLNGNKYEQYQQQLMDHLVANEITGKELDVIFVDIIVSYCVFTYVCVFCADLIDIALLLRV